MACGAAISGTDLATYTRERPGLSAFVLEDGVVYHTYSTYARTGRTHVPMARPRSEGTQRDRAASTGKLAAKCLKKSGHKYARPPSSLENQPD